MKIAYVTKQLPWGMSEAFILPEVADHCAHGWEVWFAPVTRGVVVHDRRGPAMTVDAPLFSPEIALAALAELARHPWRTVRLAARLRWAGALRQALRNLAVLPKGLWLGRRLKREGFAHIHIHFAAAPATMGVVAALVSGLPCSITAHRYDIAQNNLLAWKARHARFLRAIDEPGAEELRGHVGDHARRLSVLHMGVAVPRLPAPLRSGALAGLNLAIAARLVGKKGHALLLDALAIAAKRGQAVTLEVFGDGPLAVALRQQAARLGLGDAVRWHGAMPHDTMLAALLSGRFDAAVLPSLTTRDGDKEGIPVFLIEAMAAGLPVITTANGGIVELVGKGAGVLVPEGDAAALAAALIALAQDGDARARLAQAGRSRVIADFEIGATMRRLRARISAG